MLTVEPSPARAAKEDSGPQEIVIGSGFGGLAAAVRPSACGCASPFWRSSTRLADDADLRPVAPFYRVVFDDGTVFDDSGDAAAMRAEVGRLSPSDVEGHHTVWPLVCEPVKHPKLRVGRREPAVAGNASRASAFR